MVRRAISIQDIHSVGSSESLFCIFRIQSNNRSQLLLVISFFKFTKLCLISGQERNTEKHPTNRQENHRYED